MAGREEEERDAEGRLVCSMHSEEGVAITIYNATLSPVKAVWLDYCGKRVPYTDIPPAMSWPVQTYVTHPWLFIDSLTEERRLVGGCSILFPPAAGNSVYSVTNAPPLLWSPKTHKLFPKMFQEVTRLLLMFHGRAHSEKARARLHATDKQKGPASPVKRLWSYLRGVEVMKRLGSELTKETGRLLCDLPLDVLLRIVQLQAPYTPDIQPTPASSNNPLQETSAVL